MPQPAKSRTRCAVDLGPSAARCPTRRRRWRPSSRPARRSGRGPCPRSRRSARARRWSGCRRRRRTGAGRRPAPSDVVGVVDDAGDVGGQVHDVGQVQHERRLGDVHRRAVRSERLGDRADGVLVLLEVLRRARQRRGEGEVALVVAGAPDRAGEHPRGDQAALAADQQLGGRAEQPVDVEGPAGRVARRQPLQRPPDVDGRARPWRPGRGPARPSPARRRRSGAPPRRPRSPTRRRCGRRRRSDLARWHGGVVGERRVEVRLIAARPIVVTQVASPRRPTTTWAPPARESPGSSAKREGAERHQPRARHLTSSRTTACAARSAHHAEASSKRSAPVGADAGGDAPADQALAAAYPRGAGAVPFGSSVERGAPGSASATVRTTSGGASYSVLPEGARRCVRSRGDSLRPRPTARSIIAGFDAVTDSGRVSRAAVGLPA